ncbi:MAG: hypothetical protein HY077_18735 [Elusimicrobia bacterium]|nr:hypothetical protein [Elusimicrobiota bacterium]
MGIEALIWAAALAVPPSAVIAAYAFGIRGKRFYILGVGCACVLVAAALAPLPLRLLAQPAWLGHPLGPLPLVLVPFAALLWLLTVMVTPTGRMNEATLARTAAVCLLSMGSFLTASAWLLVLFWAGTVAVYVAGHAEPAYERARRVAAVYMGLSVILLAAGVGLTSWGVGPAAARIGAGLILAAAMIRQGIFPFHAWVPEIFERGRIGPAAMFGAPQLGTYAALVLAAPHASPALLQTVSVLALVTALYGALLALFQRDARRGCGYLFVSQSALVLAGLDLPSREALVGSLILWVSSGLALAGLARCVLVLEARRGRQSLDRFHGGYDRMRVLASCFMILSLAVMGFPATLGFVGGEMLVRGAVETFPALGLSVIAAGAFTGLAVMRMYFSLFCGRRDAGAHLSLLRSEGFGFGLAALLLLGLGLAPRGLVRVLDRAGAAAIERRGVGNARP